MSQKTNPYSSRLQKTKKRFECSWYSDYFYNDMSSNDLEIRSYIEGVLRSMCLATHQVMHSYEHLSLQNHYKRCLLFLFVVDAREMLYDKVSRGGTNVQIESTTATQSINWAQKQDTYFYQILRAFEKALRVDQANADVAGRYNHVSHDSGAKIQGVCGAHPECYTVLHGRQSCHEDSVVACTTCTYTPVWFDVSQLRFDSDLLQKCRVRSSQPAHRQKMEMASNSFHILAGGVQAVLSTTKPLQPRIFDYLHAQSDLYFSNFHTISSVQVLHSFVGVNFVINEILYLLNRRSHFREITEFLVRSASQQNLVKGIRLSCSGRFGGGSKKAQKSKTQSFQWGESGLHSFSSHISFASQSAATPFGKVGVKLWLSWRMHNWL